MLWAWLSRSMARLVLGHSHRQARTVGTGAAFAWTWKSRHRTGRPAMRHDVRALIRE
jgi:hypothetical protein